MDLVKRIKDLKESSKYKSWTEATEVVAIIPELDENGNVYVVTKYENGYSLLRFFQFGERWEISADINGEKSDKVMNRLIVDLEQ